MVLLVFEGALRKWVLPEAQAALYLAKDVLLLVAYVGFGVTKGVAVPARQALPFIALVAIAATYGLFEMLNPALPSLALAAVGWRSYFFYAPLLFIVPYLFDSLDQLYRALNRYALLAIPVAVLGIVQFFSPMDSAINANVQHEAGVGSAITFGDAEQRVRVAGSFAFISGYASYLLATALMVGALLMKRGGSLRSNLGLYAALILILAAMFATGSRAPVYSLLAASVVYVLIASATGDLSVGAAFRACAGALLLAAAVWNFLPEPTGAFQQRAMYTDDTELRFASMLLEPFALFKEAGLFGFGIGATHQSAAFLVGSDSSWWTNGLVVESETSRVMIDLGMLGFMLIYMFRIGIALSALHAALALKSRAGRSLALILALFLGMQIFGAVIFNPTMNVLYWFAVGMLFALYRYEARDARLARRQHMIAGMRMPSGARGTRVRNA